MTHLADLDYPVLTALQKKKNCWDSRAVLFEAQAILIDHVGLRETDLALIKAANRRDTATVTPLCRLTETHGQVMLQTIMALRELADARWNEARELLAKASTEVVRLYAALFLARMNVWQASLRRNADPAVLPAYLPAEATDVASVFSALAAKHSNSIAQEVAQEVRDRRHKDKFRYWRADFTADVPTQMKEVQEIFCHYGIHWGEQDDTRSIVFRTEATEASFAASLAAGFSRVCRITAIEPNPETGVVFLDHNSDGGSFFSFWARAVQTGKNRQGHQTNWLDQSI